ncbi:hypothetical protein BASA50_000427 [Batrachochytrium salamandrivorans]|uniref:Golgi apparatus membrane protein TVP23 n=1 Tax=Batrachochytrium salamandrivorans TaxID=1357716 RepID=A0ABQ8EUU3_9FUNG|nr:hypothetical protein BASA60_008566 [Batrachochytrium salamandrivorans]KAH6576089.1 hypothetical protein BASA62_001635 [Batrachochytrium salamandrivorans]KAH6581997.1 hypothetical protein BASA61_008744 [Batrachochytrium salamandrivorans]KAH6586472.1 hypothetical protein BASA50_000427 [Batrachochytrium salamandrivorans]KAH9275461.1 hypothetical protein BASA83_002235 [Batrachochytrium salamandrivorans]
MSDRESFFNSGAQAAPHAGGMAATGTHHPVSDTEAAQSEPTILQQSSHPIALIFHIVFRTAALVTYMFSWLIVSDFILTFVIIILLLAFDFWTVKNVTGRLLVGLRWWNEIRDDGTNEWIFESKENRTVNGVDSRIFWMALYIAPIAWVLLAILAILKLQASFFVITLVAVSMTMANLIGYTQCEKDAKKRVASYIADQGIMGNVVSSIISSRIGSLFGGSS